MKIHNVVQGSPEWLALRARIGRTASELPIVVGASTHTRRTDFVQMRALGDERAFTEGQIANLLDKGHAAEDGARPIVEAKLGVDLYPATITDDDDYILASVDGAPMDLSVGFEHKLWNEELAAQVRAGIVPLKHAWQMDQQGLVASLPVILFVVSDGTEERWAECWYKPDPERMGLILPAWRQFDEDVRVYVHRPDAPKPAASVEAKRTMPLLVVSVDATQIKVKDNVEDFGIALTRYIEDINLAPEDDQAFADCEEACKVLQKAQDACAAARELAIAQVVDVNAVVEKIAEFETTAREYRLKVEKLVAAQKLTIRDRIRTEAAAAYAEHITTLNAGLGGDYMPIIPADFTNAMKNKRSIAGLREGVDVELARVKIASSAMAERVRANLAYYKAEGSEWFAAFPDLKAQLAKETEHFKLLVDSRVAAAKKAAEVALAPKAAPAPEQAAAMQPATTAAPGVTTRPASAPWEAPARPTDEAIIQAIANTFRVTPNVAASWILGMDQDSLTARIPRGLVSPTTTA
jgi:hypothetical protein